MVGLKIAVSGKGGVGKTLIAGTLARLLARRGLRVLAIDADSNPNLHVTLGLRAEEAPEPLSSNEDLVEERTGAKPGSWGALFSLAPRVDDIPEKFSVSCPDGVRLLVVGAPSAGSGCMCPQSALVRALLDHLVLERDEVVILDMEAGLEPFSRATARSVDLLLVVMEPTRKSLDAAGRILSYAQKLGVRKVWGVLNKVTSKDEEVELSELARSLGLEVVVSVPFDPSVSAAERVGVSILDYDESSPFVSAVERLCLAILSGVPRG